MNRNKKRAIRRQLLVLRVRRDAIKHFVLDARDDDIEDWIVAIRKNGGSLPQGLSINQDVAAKIEQITKMPFKVLLGFQVPRSGTSRSARSRMFP